MFYSHFQFYLNWSPVSTSPNSSRWSAVWVEAFHFSPTSATTKLNWPTKPFSSNAADHVILSHMPVLCTVYVLMSITINIKHKSQSMEWIQTITTFTAKNWEHHVSLKLSVYNSISKMV